MENTIAIILMIVLLAFGGVVGAMMYGTTETIKVAGETVYKNVTVEVPGPEVIVEVPADLDSIRSNAWDAVLNEIGDEDDFLTCNGYEYDEDEIEVSKWYDNWGFTVLDDDETEVEFDVKLRFDTEDERACKEVRTYSVFFEDGEDPEVTLIE